MTATTKTCSRCHQAKPLDDFKTDVRKPDGKASACKACVAVPRVGEMVIGQLASSHEIMPPALMNDAAAWALLINARWRESAEKIIDAGRYLIAAKAALPYGEFGAMIETQLAFSASTAQRLMAIAADGRLSNPAHVQHLPPSWGTLYEITKLSDEEFDDAIERQIIRPDMERKEAEMIRDTVHGRRESQAKEPEADVIEAHSGFDMEGSSRHVAGRTATTTSENLDVTAGETAPHSPAMPSGGLAIAHQRDTSDEDPREFFPTPPWATRALIERVLVHLNRRGHCGLQKAWEPACGEGHMAEPLKEYFRAVFASDKYQYSYAAPHIDFLEFDQPISTDWIITNPPFRQSTAFVHKALKIAGTGVAMFVRLAWIEGVARYEQLLRDNQPSLLSIFTERVPLHKGRWEPDGGTFTAYAWLVWIKGMPPQPPFWIPPGCRKELFKADDVKRFGKIAEAEEAA